MADYYARELEDVAHRLLPPEILADLGIVVVDGPPSCAAPCSVEELATRLAGVLGLGGTREQRAPPPYARELQGRRGRMDGGSRDVLVGGHGVMARPHAPGSWDSTVHRLLPRFEAPDAAPFYVASCNPPARCGTGVFLPRAEAYLGRASSTSPSCRVFPFRPRACLHGGDGVSLNKRTCTHAGAKPPRMLRKEAAMMQQQQQELQLRAMAEEMEQQKRNAFAAAFQGCPALVLRQQWTY